MKKEILAGVLATAVVSGISLAGILFYLTPRMGFGVLFLFYANLFLFLFSCFALCGILYGGLFLKNDSAWPAMPACPSGRRAGRQEGKSENYRFTVLRRAFLLSFLFIAPLFLRKIGLFGYLSGLVLLLSVIGAEAYFAAKSR